MDYSQLIIACCIFFLDLIRLSQTASCDVIKIYADIQRCKTEHNVTSAGQEPDMSDINEFCRSLEASRLCTKMAVDSCDDENVKASMSPQIQQYDTLKQSSCSGGGCTIIKLHKCSQKIQQPKEESIVEICRSVKEVKACLTQVLSDCEDKTMRKRVQDTLKEMRKQEDQCVKMQVHGSAPRGGYSTHSAADSVVMTSAISSTTPSNGAVLPAHSSYVAITMLWILHIGVRLASLL